MKKCLVVSIIVSLVALSGTAFGVGGDLDYTFHWDQWTTGSINDWTKVGSAGYETYFDLVSDVDTLNDIVDPYDGLLTNLEAALRIEGADIVAPAGSWAGYEWSVPAGVNEEIVSSWMGGYFNMPAAIEMRLTDTDENVLWSSTPVAGWLGGGGGITTSTFAGVDTVRLIAYTTSDIRLWGAGNFLSINPLYLNTTVPEPATMALLGLGGLLLRRRK